MTKTHEMILRYVAQVTGVTYNSKHLYFTGSRRYELGHKSWLNEEVARDDRDFDVVVYSPGGIPTLLENLRTAAAGEGRSVVTAPYRSWQELRAERDGEKVEVRSYPPSTISGYIEILGVRVNIIGLSFEKDFHGWVNATNFMSAEYAKFPALREDKDLRVCVFHAVRGVHYQSFSGKQVDDGEDIAPANPHLLPSAPEPEYLRISALEEEERRIHGLLLPELPIRPDPARYEPLPECLSRFAGELLDVVTPVPPDQALLREWRGRPLESPPWDAEMMHVLDGNPPGQHLIRLLINELLGALCPSATAPEAMGCASTASAPEAIGCASTAGERRVSTIKHRTLPIHTK